MKAVKIDLFECDSPFKFRFHSPHVIRHKAESVVVAVKFNSDITGYGESAPRSYVTGETVSSVVNVIQNYASKILFDNEINALEDIDHILNEMEKVCIGSNVKAYNSALGAIDIALIDAFGKSRRKKLQDFLFPIARNSISRSLPVPILTPSELMNLYKKLDHVEFDSVKVLLGNEESDNIETLKLIRSLFGNQMEIRIEANGKWSQNEAISFVEKLKKFNISAVEQPVRKDDIKGLQAVRTMTGIPVIVDESMCTLSDAQNLIENDACDIINIKVSKCGGLLRSRSIADFAQSRNVRCQVGTHVGETEILHKAGQYLAMTIPNLYCFEGFSPLLFKNRGKVDSSRPELENISADLSLRLICSLAPGR